MKKIIYLSTLLYSTLLVGQIQRLTINDLLGGPAAGGRRGSGGEGLPSPDGKYIATLKDNQIALKLADGGEEKIVTSSPGPTGS